MNFQFGTVDQYLMRTKGEELKQILSPPLLMDPRHERAMSCKVEDTKWVL